MKKKTYIDKYNMKISSFLGFVFIFFFNINCIAENLSQEVYLADEPLPQIAAKLKKEGLSQQQITEYLKNTLINVTPELAKKKFNIRWIDNVWPREYLIKQIEHLFKIGRQIMLDYQKLHNDTVDFNNPVNYFDGLKDRYEHIKYSPKIYPPVVISYINDQIGYGLFSLEAIEPGDIIAEYSGIIYERQGGFLAVEGREQYEVIKDSDGKEYPVCGYYGICTRFEGTHIEACKAGNAARFASSIPLEEDLINYTQKLIQKEKALGQCQLDQCQTVIEDFLSLKSKLDTNIATANASIFFSICDCETDKCGIYPDLCEEPHTPRTFLVAIKKIKPFEQIGFSYYDIEEGLLFDKNGGIVTYEDYKKMALDSLNKN